MAGHPESLATQRRGSRVCEGNRYNSGIRPNARNRTPTPEIQTADASQQMFQGWFNKRKIASGNKTN